MVGLLLQTCLDEDRGPNQTPQVGGLIPAVVIDCMVYSIVRQDPVTVEAREPHLRQPGIVGLGDWREPRAPNGTGLSGLARTTPYPS